MSATEEEARDKLRKEIAINLLDKSGAADYATMPTAQHYIDALAGGESNDEEIETFQTLLREAFAVFTDDQKKLFAERCEVRESLECALGLRIGRLKGLHGQPSSGGSDLPTPILKALEAFGPKGRCSRGHADGIHSFTLSFAPAGGANQSSLDDATDTARDAFENNAT